MVYKNTRHTRDSRGMSSGKSDTANKLMGGDRGDTATWREDTDFLLDNKVFASDISFVEIFHNSLHYFRHIYMESEKLLGKLEMSFCYSMPTPSRSVLSASRLVPREHALAALLTTRQDG